jgi:peptidyl-prolyl isomerase G (cyclophilin G)
VFGKVVTGLDVLRQMAKVPVGQNDTPLTPVLISKSGELMYRPKESSKPKADKSADKTEANNSGSESGSGSSSDSGSDSEEEKKKKKKKKSKKDKKDKKDKKKKKSKRKVSIARFSLTFFLLLLEMVVAFVLVSFQLI